jgi:mono/diheme cytochrome c family protein
MNTIAACLLFGLVLGGRFTAPSCDTALETESMRAISHATGRVRAAHTSLRIAQGAADSNGLYTASQAERGKAVYEQSCSSCHGASLRGGANEFAAPALAGPFFYEKWTGRTVEELFQYAAEKMPPDETRLSQAAYLDVTAYILQVLKYPAGATELSTDSPAMKQKLEPRQ